MLLLAGFYAGKLNLVADKIMTTNLPEGKVKISVNIPEQLLLDLDLERKKSNQDRSNWITSAVMEKLALIKKERT